MPGRLRREEGLEDPREGRGVHSAAVVAHGEHDVRPRAPGGVRRDVRLVELHVARLDPERPALRHRVARVHGEVHEHLLDLTGVGLHASEAGREVLADPHVLAEEAREHRLGVRDDFVQDEDRDPLDLLAAEREELPRQRGRALGGPADLGDLREGGLAQRTLRQELGVAKDRGEEVIEVVCDPAGELADSFHPGRLPLPRLIPDPLSVVQLHSISPEAPAGQPEVPPVSIDGWEGCFSTTPRCP